MYIPTECIGFHLRWLSAAPEEDETMEDLETLDLAKAILSIHYDYDVRTGKDPDGLLILDQVVQKVCCYTDHNGIHRIRAHKKRQREDQVRLAKQLIGKGTLSLVDAMCLLFTKDELGIYGI